LFSSGGMSLNFKHWTTASPTVASFLKTSVQITVGSHAACRQLGVPKHNLVVVFNKQATFYCLFLVQNKSNSFLVVNVSF
jgi:hypothetical protein